jgi:predicted DNA-binding mobile mystery protein A
MKTSFQRLKLKQVDHALAPWRTQELGARPPGGWIRAIRESLGMSSSVLAKRAGMSSSGVVQLENSEMEGTITLASLKKMAEALGCDLRYAIVPRISLEQTVQSRAEQVARARIRAVAHSMALEDQRVDEARTAEQLAALTKELLEGPRRNLW